jgi:hypothetical protein
VRLVELNAFFLCVHGHLALIEVRDILMVYSPDMTAYMHGSLGPII